MKISPVIPRKVAFSRLELLVVLALLSFLLPVFGISLCKAWAVQAQLSCAAQLKAMAFASLQFADDYADWPWHVPPIDGGTSAWAESGDIAPHFQVLSNYLTSPSILVCPTDRDRRSAPKFEVLHRRNLSYFAGLGPQESCSASRRRASSGVRRIFFEESYRGLLAGDRTITGGIPARGRARIFRPEGEVGWNLDLHSGRGNVALTDGSVLSRAPGPAIQEIIADSYPQGTLIVIP